MPEHAGMTGSAAGAGRFAPSPTGELHLGNLRTALLAWLFARTSGRAILLRIEDLDAQRSRAEHERGQRADLAALGLSFDPPELRQSTRAARYAEALRRLDGQTFECFCTRREIAEAASAPHGPTGRYPGTCRRLTEGERVERRRTRTPAIRLASDGSSESITDLLAGDVVGVVDDVVLRRNDGGYAYNLAVVADDLDSSVDQVVRGDDLLDTAPAQARLTRLLGGGRAPVYAHVPLALGPGGDRLAKRDGAVTLTDLAAHGVGPAEVLTRLAVSLDLARPGEPVTLPLLAARFDPDQLPRTPWVVDG